jgi:hypothetical protein
MAAVTGITAGTGIMGDLMFAEFAKLGAKPFAYTVTRWIFEGATRLYIYGQNYPEGNLASHIMVTAVATMVLSEGVHTDQIYLIFGAGFSLYSLGQTIFYGPKGVLMGIALGASLSAVRFAVTSVIGTPAQQHTAKIMVVVEMALFALADALFPRVL